MDEPAPDATPSGRGHTVSERGGTPVGRRARLPRGAEEPVRVFINGVEQKRGVDYELVGGNISFTELIYKEGKIKGWRLATLALGVIGVYRKHEVVDVEYSLNGARRFVSDLEVQPDE